MARPPAFRDVEPGLHLVTVAFDEPPPARQAPRVGRHRPGAVPARAVGQRGQIRQGWVERQPDGATVHSGLGDTVVSRARRLDVRGAV